MSPLTTALCRCSLVRTFNMRCILWQLHCCRIKCCQKQITFELSFYVIYCTMTPLTTALCRDHGSYVVWVNNRVFLIKLLMNSFGIADAAIFLMQAMLTEDFNFSKIYFYFYIHMMQGYLMHAIKHSIAYHWTCASEHTKNI